MSSQPLWAPLGDALKLILTGYTNRPLSPTQRAIFLNMLARATKDDSGKTLKSPALEGVETQQYCVDEENQRLEQYWYIPGIVRYMMKAFEEWDFFNPPLALDYLNSLVDKRNRHLFIYGAAPGYQGWAASEEGQAHWSLICRKLDLEREIDEVQKTHHANDPLRLEAQRRMKKELEVELKKIDRKISAFETYPTEEKYPISPRQTEWKLIARELAIKHVKAFPHLSVEQIAKKVHADLVEKNITGRGGRVPKPETIKRQALAGIKN